MGKMTAGTLERTIAKNAKLFERHRHNSNDNLAKMVGARREKKVATQITFLRVKEFRSFSSSFCFWYKEENVGDKKENHYSQSMGLLMLSEEHRVYERVRPRLWAGGAGAVTLGEGFRFVKKS